MTYWNNDIKNSEPLARGTKQPQSDPSFMTLHFQAIIRPQMAEQVFLELAEGAFVRSLVAEEVQGSGTRSVRSLGSTTEAELLPKVAIGGFIKDEDLERVVSCLRGHASTGRSGDGKIFVSRVLSEL